MFLSIYILLQVLLFGYLFNMTHDEMDLLELRIEEASDVVKAIVLIVLFTVFLPATIVSFILHQVIKRGQ